MVLFSVCIREKRNCVSSSLKYFLTFIFVGISSIESIGAQSDQWEFTGLSGEKIMTIAFAKSDSGTVLYAGSFSDYSAEIHGKIFRSSDDGNSWDTLLTFVDLRRIVVHPQDPSILYAALGFSNSDPPGIIKSVDGGDTWYWADSGVYTDWETGVKCVAFDIDNPETLYAGTMGLYGGSVYKTTDGGTNWIDIGEGIEGSNVTEIVVDHHSPQVVYVGTGWNGAVNKSTGGGAHWFLTGLHDVGVVFSLAIDNNNNSILYASSRDSLNPSEYVLYKSVDSGANWTEFDATESGYAFGKIRFRPNNPDELYVTTNGGVYFSCDAGTTWTSMNEGLDNTISWDLAFFPSGDTLFCGTASGVYRRIFPSAAVSETYQQHSPQTVILLGNYPNPLNDRTIVKFALTKQAHVRLDVFDLIGSKVTTLMEGTRFPGVYAAVWDGKSELGHYAPSGVYFYRLTVHGLTMTRKMIVIK